MKQNLTSIDLVNYRKFKKLYLEFPARLNVFVGQNGSGKTSAMKAIEKILNKELTNEEDRPIKESNKGRSYKTKITGKLSERYSIILSESSVEVINSKGKSVKQITIPELVCISASRNKSIESHSESVDNFVFTNNDTQTLIKMVEPYASKRIKNIDNSSEINVNAKKLLESIEIKTNPSSKIKGYSSGKISFEFIANRIRKFDDGVIIIEEPEVYLHPQQLNSLVALIYKKFETSKSKIFISTHSPNVANFLIRKGADLFYFTNEESNPVIKFKNNDFEFLNENISNFSFSDFFFSKIIFVVEGRTEEIVIREELLKRGYFDYSVVDMSGPSKDRIRECVILFQKMQNLQVRFVFDNKPTLGDVYDEGNVLYYHSHDSIESLLCSDKNFISAAKKTLNLKTKKEVQERIKNMHDGTKTNYHIQLRKILTKIDKPLAFEFLKNLP